MGSPRSLYDSCKATSRGQETPQGHTPSQRSPVTLTAPDLLPQLAIADQTVQLLGRLLQAPGKHCKQGEHFSRQPGLQARAHLCVRNSSVKQHPQGEKQPVSR